MPETQWLTEAAETELAAQVQWHRDNNRAGRLEIHLNFDHMGQMASVDIVPASRKYKVSQR